MYVFDTAAGVVVNAWNNYGVSALSRLHSGPTADPPQLAIHVAAGYLRDGSLGF